MIDKCNREINYARISLTSKCNLKCKYCIGEPNNYEISADEYKTIIKTLGELKFNKLRFTGGEPLLNHQIYDLIEYAKSFESIKDIGITTNGVNLSSKLVKLKETGLSRINISLDTLNRQKYLELTGYDKLDEVINSIKDAIKMGFKVKINCVVLSDFNVSEFENMIEFGRKNKIIVRFIELMKIGDNSEFVNSQYYNISSIIKDKYQKIEIDKQDVCDYYLDNGYIFGVILPISNHFCNKCNRIRFTSDGYLRLCLHSDNDIDIRNYLHDSKLLKDVIENHMGIKPEKHLLNDNEVATSRNMSKIGG